VLSDVHGNIRALDAVLTAAPAVDAWLFAGDAVGYYPDVNEVCKSLLDIGALCVRGNHDSYVAGQLAPKPEHKSLYRTAWTREHLKREYLDWISSLPAQLDLNFQNKSFTIRHASPWDEETYLYPDSPRLSEIRLPANSFLVLGHTHWPMIIQAGDGHVLNPGSVGQPRDYNTAASYALVEIETGAATLCRASYDVAAYQQYLSKLGWPESTISILSRSRVQPSDR